MREWTGPSIVSFMDKPLSRMDVPAVDRHQTWSSSVGDSDLEGEGASAEWLLPWVTAAQSGPADPVYERVRLLEKGGMGEVDLVFDHSLEREVARKRVPLDDMRRLERFRAEVRVTARLQHPGIVPVHASGVDGSHAWFTMKHVAGVTLKDLPKEGDPGKRIRSRLDVLLRVCDALAYAHRQGIVHRDLKPANIMVGEFGEVVVLDWGIAMRSGEGELGRVCGTPGWMSPEQARGQAIDARTDIWSLGLLLLFLLTDQEPLSVRNLAGHIRWLESREVGANLFTRRHPKVPVALWSVIQRCTALDPSDRYSDVEALAVDIRDWLAGRRISAHRYTVPERLGRLARKHGLLFLGGGVMSNVLVLGVVLYQQKTDAELAATIFRMQLGGYATSAAVIAAAAVEEGSITAADFGAAAAMARSAWVLPEASAGAWCSDSRAVFVTHSGLVEWRDGDAPRPLRWESPVDVTCAAGNLTVLDASGLVSFVGEPVSAGEWAMDQEGGVTLDGHLLGWRLDPSDGARFSADGRLLVRPQVDGSGAWDASTGAYLGSLRQVDAVMDRSRHAQAEIAVEATSQGVDVRRDGRLMYRIHEPGPVLAVALAPDARRLLAIGADGRAWILSVDALGDSDLARVDRTSVLSHTNLRTCRDLRRVVAVSPFPAPGARWAPMDVCR